MVELDALLDKLDRLLDDGQFDQEVELCTRLYLNFCDQLASAMTPAQSSAYDVAKRYWTRCASDTERRAALKSVSNNSPGSDLKSEAVRKLVFGALTNTEGLTWFGGEYLILSGSEAGLSPFEMEEIFKKNVPGY